MDESASGGEDLVQAFLYFRSVDDPTHNFLRDNDQVNILRKKSEFRFVYGECAVKVYCKDDYSLARLIDEHLLVLADTATVETRLYAPEPCYINLHPRGTLDIIFWVKIGIKRDSVELVSERLFRNSYDSRLFLDIRLDELNDVDDSYETLLSQWKTSKQFLSSLAEDYEYDDDIIMCSSLSDHQKHGVRWMIDREEEYADDSQIPLFWEENNGVYKAQLCDFITLKRPDPIKGGIFADETGMGKTLALLSLIAYSKKSLAKQRKNTKYSVPATTLVVCPPCAVATWKQQINKWTTRPGVLKHCTYSANKDLDWLMQHDLVFATYNQASQPDSLLYQVEWSRVIVDDVHVYLQGLTSSPVKPPFANLKTKRRWAVTGRVNFEEFQNLCPILCFLGLPLHHYRVCDKLRSKVSQAITINSHYVTCQSVYI